jgi:hypothetical protein
MTYYETHRSRWKVLSRIADIAPTNLGQSAICLAATAAPILAAPAGKGHPMAHPATPATETTSRFHFPSAYTILFALIVIIAGLTWVIPAGQYERVASEALGKDVPVAGTYAPTDANPQGFFDVILAPSQASTIRAATAPMPSTWRCSC